MNIRGTLDYQERRLKSTNEAIADIDRAYLDFRSRRGKLVKRRWYHANKIREIKEKSKLVCPKKDCPYPGCQHHEKHDAIWAHSVNFCTSPSHRPMETCPVCVLVGTLKEEALHSGGCQGRYT